jgi:hypothetical protein
MKLKLNIGRWCWGPRFLLPILPLIILPLGSIIDSDYFKKRKLPQVILIITIATGIVTQVPAVLANYNRYYYHYRVSEKKFSSQIGQWQMCFQVISNMIEGKPWNLSLKSYRFSNQEMLTKSRTMNIIDFWWIHLYYIIKSKIWITLIPCIFRDNRMCG